MYSYEYRIRAAELYTKLGKRLRTTIRQLGYPSKNALKGWHREYKQRLDLPVGYEGPGPLGFALDEKLRSLWLKN